MKWSMMVAVGAVAFAAEAGYAAGKQADADTFDAFRKHDREAFEAFRAGRSRGVTAARASRAMAPARLRAQELYDTYCRVRGTLEDPDPEKGILTRIGALRAKLYPTNRPWVDCLSLWGDHEWDVEWPLLQDLEARAVQSRDAMRQLEAAWRDEGFSQSIGRGLDDCYGRKAWYIYHDKDDQTVFPSPIRSNQVDYVSFHMNAVWPTNDPPAVTAPPTAPPEPEAVVHDAPPPPDPPAPEIPEIDEEIREENVESVKAWDDMTPAERRRALMENRPEAWSGFCRDVFGTDTNGHALAKAVVACSNVTAVTTNRAIANLPPPTAIVPGKTWDAMTTEERHDALKAIKPEAWDGLRDALLSGDPGRIQQVLDALTPKAVLSDAVRAVAYWHGYQVGQMEAATNPENSTIDTVAAAYVHPELTALVRKGYADAKAGNAPQFTLPDAASLQQMMTTPAVAPPAAQP